MKKLLLLVLLLATSLIIPIHAAMADDQDGERITLSPAVSRPALEAGQTISGKLTVINDGTSDYTFRLYARPFSVTGEQYDPNYTEVNERTQAYQWVQFDRTEAQLAAEERIEVAYTVSVPENAAPGGHYAVLFAETQPPQGENENVVRKKRVGSLLYMTVAGEFISSGSLLDLETDLLQTKRPVTAGIRIQNDGNVHFPAMVNAHYSTIFGNKRFELNQESLILPGTTRRIPIVWENTPYFGIFKTGGSVDFLDRTEELPTRWVILAPYPLLLGLGAAVICLMVFIIVKKRRRSNNRKGVRTSASKKRR